MRHLATKADVLAIKADIEAKFASQLKWLIGVLISVILAVAAILRFIPS